MMKLLERGSLPVFGGWARSASLAVLALALAPSVRVVGVAPGLTLTSPLLSDEQFQARHKMALLGQSSTPQDVASTVRFALDNNSITGNTNIGQGTLQLGANNALFPNQFVNVRLRDVASGDRRVQGTLIAATETEAVVRLDDAELTAVFDLDHKRAALVAFGVRQEQRKGQIRPQPLHQRIVNVQAVSLPYVVARHDQPRQRFGQHRIFETRLFPVAAAIKRHIDAPDAAAAGCARSGVRRGGCRGGRPTRPTPSSPPTAKACCRKPPKTPPALPPATNPCSGCWQSSNRPP